MTQFNTNPNAAADAKPDAMTFRYAKDHYKAGWHWYRRSDFYTASNPVTPHGPFDSEALAIADAQKDGA